MPGSCDPTQTRVFHANRPFVLGALADTPTFFVVARIGFFDHNEYYSLSWTHMDKRKIAKQNTRDAILHGAEHLFLERGIDETTTAEIAKRCGIAHGTIFVHFSTRDALVSAVFIAVLRRLAVELENAYEQKGTFGDLLRVFLDFVHRHERFFSVYFRALPSFAEELKREILSFEVAVRDNFHRALRDADVAPGSIAAVLNVLFAQLIYYYSFREVLCGSNSVIETYGKAIEHAVLKLAKPVKQQKRRRST